jgi:hypothetical protein
LRAASFKAAKALAGVFAAEAVAAALVKAAGAGLAGVLAAGAVSAQADALKALKTNAAKVVRFIQCSSCVEHRSMHGLHAADKSDNARAKPHADTWCANVGNSRGFCETDNRSVACLMHRVDTMRGMGHSTASTLR